MSKLELKHLAPYLPYGLKIMSSWGTIFLLDTQNSIGGTPEKRDIGTAIANCYKPIHHPLSDLVKPCHPEGKIPILELAKIVFDKRDNPDEFLFQSLKENTVFMAFPDKRNVFGYDSNTKSFFGSSSGLAASVVNQLELFEWLFEHHFDIYGLIDQDLAVDINTLQK